LSKLKSDLAEHLPQIGTSQGDRLHYHLAQKLIGLCDVYKYERATDCEKIDNSSKQELKSLEELLQKQEDFVAASNQIIEVVKNLWLEIFNKEASSGVQKIQFQY
jgi:putative lipase involved disintegration of autophagic bodies